MDNLVQPCLSRQSRKRQRHPETWERNVKKRERYFSKQLPERPKCRHNTRAFKCGNISMADIKYFHNAFFKHPEKSKQDAFLLKYCKPKNIKRRRGKKDSERRKLLQTKYKVFSLSQRSVVPVCQKAFLNILHISKHRVQTIMKHFFNTGTLLTEKRGGNHKQHLFQEKLTAVKFFINTFNCDEPHYCRSKTKRYYLPAELSINKMCNMYNVQADHNLEVTKGYFRKIFNNYYNLGFGSPRTDVCSTCLQYDELIKTYDKDLPKKNDILIQKRVHKLRAKAFFELVREEKGHMITFCFDCQKNCPMPKLPDQSTYYSRQLYLYNFTIVQGNSKASLSPDNTFAYCWTEDTFAKSSNEIASAVYHRLCSTDWTGIKTVRLIADGCGGQNKNSTMITMLAKWLTNNAPNNLKMIELIFPVVGHSFIPPDRVFGFIEKDVRKMEIIKNPRGYLNIIKNYSTVIHLGKGDCKVYNWRDASKTVIKDVGSWHFPFQKSKRFYIKRTKSRVNVVVKGDMNYKVSNGVYRGITKRQKHIIIMNVTEIFSSGNLNKNKVIDVKKLLIKHYGENWADDEDLVYFKKTISGENVDGGDNRTQYNENEEVLCQWQEDTPDLKV